MIYLYLKTHRKTGYQYLGKTIQDPFKYRGSGLIWQHHLKKHGPDIHTQILLATECEIELRETGLFFSKLFGVVQNTNFANLTEEMGQGGRTPISSEARKRQGDKLRGLKRPNTDAYVAAQRKRAPDISAHMILWHQNPTNYQSKLNQLKCHAQSPTARAKRSTSISKLRWCNDGVKNYRLSVVPSTHALGRI